MWGGGTTLYFNVLTKNVYDFQQACGPPVLSMRSRKNFARESKNRSSAFFLSSDDVVCKVTKQVIIVFLFSKIRLNCIYRRSSILCFLCFNISITLLQFCRPPLLKKFVSNLTIVSDSSR